MTMIEQTVNVSPDGKIHLDVDLPEEAKNYREANVRVWIEPSQTQRKRGNIGKYYGCLKDSHLWEGDSVEIIRKIRDEW
jgi:Tfp pilus assembly protein PilZ